ncbi:hypothetical protein POM88_037107 [Heracleum sosnowskyi]|nr:hypothetical protein POM88_037107 [Heracleum sosnowskyi]
MPTNGTKASFSSNSYLSLTQIQCPCGLIGSRKLSSKGLLSKCSSILRKVLDFRELAMTHISYQIGNGSSIFFWFDTWYNGVPICTIDSDPIIAYSGMPSYSKVSSVISSNGWCLPSSNYHSMLVWSQSFQRDYPYNLNLPDTLLWNGKKLKSICITDLWHTVRHGARNVEWGQNVWHKLKLVTQVITG